MDGRQCGVNQRGRLHKEASSSQSSGSRAVNPAWPRLLSIASSVRQTHLDDRAGLQQKAASRMEIAEAPHSSRLADASDCAELLSG